MEMFLIGLFVGASLGALLVGLTAASSRAEDLMRSFADGWKWRDQNGPAKPGVVIDVERQR